MSKKKRVGLLFGGESLEHDVSLSSALRVARAFDKERFELLPLYRTKKGRWKEISLQEMLLSSPELLPLSGFETPFPELDVAFPLIHGTLGEDGHLQGFLKLQGVPFAGPDLKCCAMAMDKEITKRLVTSHGIQTAPFLVGDFSYAEIVKKLGLPFFLKPANLGSSFGVERIVDEVSFNISLKRAFEMDSKVLFEQEIVGREIECALFGAEEMVASLPGEIIPPRGAFYDYALKTVRADEVTYAVPAQLSPEMIREVQRLSIRAFKALDGEGMARVDFFLTAGGELYLNEINPIPGFTETSLYPNLFEVSGLQLKDLLTALIDLAFTRQQKRASDCLIC